MWSAKYLPHMNHMNVSPTDGNGPTQGQRKTLTRVGIEPTTFGLDHRCSTDWATRSDGSRPWELTMLKSRQRDPMKLEIGWAGSYLKVRRLKRALNSLFKRCTPFHSGKRDNSWREVCARSIFVPFRLQSEERRTADHQSLRHPQGPSCERERKTAIWCLTLQNNQMMTAHTYSLNFKTLKLILL